MSKFELLGTWYIMIIDNEEVYDFTTSYFVTETEYANIIIRKLRITIENKNQLSMT